MDSRVESTVPPYSPVAEQRACQPTSSRIYFVQVVMRHANRIEWLQMLEKSLLGMQSRGEIVLNGDIEAEIQGVDAIINGIALQAILDPDEWPVERQLAQLRCYFVRLRPFDQVKGEGI